MARPTRWVQVNVVAWCSAAGCDWSRRTDGGDTAEGQRVVAAGKSHARKPGHSVAIERGQVQSWGEPLAAHEDGDRRG